MTESQLRAEIARLQEIQKRNAPTTQVWKQASAALAPLFRQMATLQDAGELRLRA